MSRVAIDCDGVLADFNYTAAKVMNGIVKGFVSDPAQFQPSTDRWIPPEHLEEFRFRVRQTNNWWLFLDAYADNISAFHRFIHSAPHIVYIVTARFPTEGMSVEQQTWEWLRSCGVEGNHWGHLGVIVVPRIMKPRIMAAMKFDYSIDDNIETVRANNRQSNHRSFVLDQPWNQHSSEPRVRTLDEFFRMVNEHDRNLEHSSR